MLPLSQDDKCLWFLSAVWKGVLSLHLYLWGPVSSGPQAAEIICTSGFLTHQSGRDSTALQQDCGCSRSKTQPSELMSATSRSLTLPGEGHLCYPSHTKAAAHPLVSHRRSLDYIEQGIPKPGPIFWTKKMGCAEQK